jgi:hypothetical protein
LCAWLGTRPALLGSPRQLLNNLGSDRGGVYDLHSNLHRNQQRTQRYCEVTPRATLLYSVTTYATFAKSYGALGWYTAELPKVI